MKRYQQKLAVLMALIGLGGSASCESEPDPDPVKPLPDDANVIGEKVPVEPIPPKGEIDTDQEVKNMARVLTSNNWILALKHYKDGGGVYVDAEFNKESMEAALHHFELVAEEQPNNPMPLESMGDALMHLGRYKEALEMFGKSLEIQETFSSRYSMARAFKELENYPMMVKSLRIAIEHEPVLHDGCRFSEDFENVRGIPEMVEFEEQYR